MTSPSPHSYATRPRRFGLGQVLLIAGILVFGAFVLLTEGRTTTDGLLNSFDQIVSH
jgi:hypothetical protein